MAIALGVVLGAEIKAGEPDGAGQSALRSSAQGGQWRDSWAGAASGSSGVAAIPSEKDLQSNWQSMLRASGVFQGASVGTAGGNAIEPSEVSSAVEQDEGAGSEKAFFSSTGRDAASRSTISAGESRGISLGTTQRTAGQATVGTQIGVGKGGVRKERQEQAAVDDDGPQAEAESLESGSAARVNQWTKSGKSTSAGQGAKSELETSARDGLLDAAVSAPVNPMLQVFAPQAQVEAKTASAATSLGFGERTPSQSAEVTGAARNTGGAATIATNRTAAAPQIAARVEAKARSGGQVQLSASQGAQRADEAGGAPAIASSEARMDTLSQASELPRAADAATAAPRQTAATIRAGSATQAAAVMGVTAPGSGTDSQAHANGADSSQSFNLPSNAEKTMVEGGRAAEGVRAQSAHGDSNGLPGQLATHADLAGAGAGADTSVVVREPGSLGVVNGGPMGSGVLDGPSAGAPARETFASLDANTAVGAPAWIHAAGQHAEAGFEDPALGWVGVRADFGAGGVHAAVMPGSAEAAQALNTHLAGLNAFLAERHSAMAPVTMAAPGGSGMETGAGQNMQQGAGQNAERNGAAETQWNRQIGASGTAEPRTAAAESFGGMTTMAGAAEGRGRHISVMA